MEKVIVFILLTTVSSCGYQLWFEPKYITYQYDEQHTGLDSLIKIDGYYVSEVVIPKDTVLFKPYVNLLLFYKDGSIVRTNSQPAKEACEKMIDKFNFKKTNHKPWNYQWGLYEFVDDTVVSQIIKDDGPMSLPGVFERKFLIISDTVLKMVYEKELSPEYPPNKIKGDGLFYFHPYPNRIDASSNPYLKKKWFWDKEAYKKRAAKK